MDNVIRGNKVNDLIGVKVLDFVMSNGDPGQEKILTHWEDHFQRVGSAYYVKKEGKTSTLWKKDNSMTLKGLSRKGDAGHER